MRVRKVFIQNLAVKMRNILYHTYLATSITVYVYIIIIIRNIECIILLLLCLQWGRLSSFCPIPV